MRRLSEKQRASMEAAVAAYEKHLPEANSYLSARGITYAAATAARLGVVVSPEEGHESATGRLCIPFLNKAGVFALKFRCLRAHDCKAVDCPKYLNVGGAELGLYGVVDVDTISDVIHICEGELDRLVLKMVLDQPVVGVPGVDHWKPHHPFHFAGFDRVLVWRDGDKAGKAFAQTLRRDIPAAEEVVIPDGHDVNSLYLAAGAGRLLELAGLEAS